MRYIASTNTSGLLQGYIEDAKQKYKWTFSENCPLNGQCENIEMRRRCLKGDLK